MRTMPVELTSSVEVASTERAQRMHRRTSTEAMGRCTESMLYRYPAACADDEVEETSESEDDEEADEP